jgi:hypothetical protein
MAHHDHQKKHERAHHLHSNFAALVQARHSPIYDGGELKVTAGATPIGQVRLTVAEGAVAAHRDGLGRADLAELVMVMQRAKRHVDFLPVLPTSFASAAPQLSYVRLRA